MKLSLTHLNSLRRYHWNNLIQQDREEPDRWSNQVVPIIPASQYPNWRQVLDKSPLKKAKDLFHGIIWTLPHLLGVKLSHRLAWFESLLKIKGSNIYRGICYCPESFQPTFLITDPNIITAILMHERNEVGEHALFSGGVPTQIAKKILGNNILTCPEKEHKNLQHFSAPHFTPQAVASYFPTFLKSSSELIQKWLASGDKPVNISKDLPIFAASAVAENLLGFQGSTTELCQAMHTLLDINQKSFLFPKDRKRYAEALNFIHTAAESACHESRPHFLKCMTEAKYQNGQSKFSIADVMAMAKILFFAGQDSTSSLLAYLLYTLGQPSFISWQDRLYQEFQQTGRDPLKFVLESQSLDHLFKEGLRVYPSAFTQTRETVQDFIIDHRFFIPKGSLLYLLHYFSQRDSRRWGLDAHLFNPDRFKEPTLSAKTHGPLQYFSLGPTICLGRHFVMLLMKTFLTYAIQTTRWISCLPNPHIEAEIMLELKPYVNIQFSLRNQE